MATTIDNLGVQFRAIAAANWDASKAQDNIFYSVQNTDNSYDLYLGSQLLSNQDEVDAAVARIGQNEQSIQALQTLTAGFGNSTIKAYVDNAIAALDSGALASRVAANEAAITKINDETIPAAITTAGTNADNKISAYDTATVQPISTKVTTLIGSDNGKSVRTIANEELAAQLIPEDAKDSLDTLQEIAAWIQDHPDDAAAMNQKILNIENGTTVVPKATHAVSADSATNANHATSADSATNADNAAKLGGIEANKYAQKTTTLEGYGITDAYTKEESEAKFATAAQGTKADTALQQSDIVEGTENGTISVKGTDVAVHGLGSAAYVPTSTFDSAGAAAAVLGTADDGIEDVTVYGVKAYAYDIAITNASGALQLANKYTNEKLAEALAWKALSSME